MEHLISLNLTPVKGWEASERSVGRRLGGKF